MKIFNIVTTGGLYKLVLNSSLTPPKTLWHTHALIMTGLVMTKMMKVIKNQIGTPRVLGTVIINIISLTTPLKMSAGILKWRGNSKKNWRVAKIYGLVGG